MPHDRGWLLRAVAVASTRGRVGHETTVRAKERPDLHARQLQAPAKQRRVDVEPLYLRAKNIAPQ